jgi:hypothetical protein
VLIICICPPGALVWLINLFLFLFLFHCLNIERGRYNKPKIPREERFCKLCTEVEREEHFLISYHKYKDIRKTFFLSDGLDLKDSHNTYFLLSKLLSPKNIIECNYLYKFIRDALEISDFLKYVYNCIIIYCMNF